MLISKEIIGQGRSYEDQQKFAKEINKNVPGMTISGFMDTAISMFMEYVRSGERNFQWDWAKLQYNWVRVNELTRGMRLGIGFAPSGLVVFNATNNPDNDVGFAFARKSFG